MKNEKDAFRHVDIEAHLEKFLAHYGDVDIEAPAEVYIVNGAFDFTK